jgi:hypothetical protein
MSKTFCVVEKLTDSLVFEAEPGRSLEADITMRPLSISSFAVFLGGFSLEQLDSFISALVNTRSQLNDMIVRYKIEEAKDE